METVTDFIFLGSKITVDGDCSHEIKRCLLLRRKAMTNIDSILKSRDITLPTKVCLVKVKVKSLSHVQLFGNPWTVAYQAPPSMGFSRQEYWSGLPFPSTGDLPDTGIKPRSPGSQVDSLPTELREENHISDYTDLCWQSNLSAFKYALYVCHSFSSKEYMFFNFMAAVTVCSDFGAQENKGCHCFHCFPIYLP